MDYTMLRPKRVWEALAGHPDRPSLRTVTRWCEGAAQPPGWAESLIRAAIGVDVGQDERSAPAWAEALAQRTATQVIGLLAPPELQEAAERVRERLEALPEQGGGAPRATRGAPGAGTSRRPDPALS